MSYQPGFRAGWGGRSRRGESSWFLRGGSSGRRGAATPTPTPPRPLGTTVDTISISALLVEEEEPQIQDVKYVSSYNWLDSSSPIILVPGSPPAWTPPTEDVKLRPDSQDVYRDINAAHYPPYPMEPTIRSIRAMKPEFDLQDINLIGCGSTIGNLLRFVGEARKPFRFDADIVGDTVIFVRREGDPKELIQDLHGYGHTFPEAYTTWNTDARNSCSHQRVIQYEFGGLKFLVRTETDGYIQKESLAKPNTAVEAPPVEDLLISLHVKKSQGIGNSELELRQQGSPVDQEQIFDIKTRASYKAFDLAEILPRLWVNQTSKFLIAYHKTGLFNKPQPTDVKGKVLQWQKENATLLAKYQSLVKRIIDVLRDAEKGPFEISWGGQGPLKITQQLGESRRALPSELLQFWETS